MIELYQFGSAWGLPDPSPFCVKLELWLKMAGLEYRSVIDGDTRKAPKGKIPYIKLDGEPLGDSELIIDRLTQRFEVAMDAQLNADQRALSHLITRMMHDSCYWVLLQCRWVNESGWTEVRPALFGSLPKPLQILVPPLIRRSVKKGMINHGLGRHSPDEIVEFARKDFDALEAMLGEQLFMLGDKPHGVDATVQGFLISFIGPPIDNPVKQDLFTRPRLLDYYNRMNQQFMPQIPAATAATG
ncbi:MAG: glutathione S-transferase family protein [Gammaproteobacteria bacterium]